MGRQWGKERVMDLGREMGWGSSEISGVQWVWGGGGVSDGDGLGIRWFWEGDGL